jgi:septin family protein
MFWDMAAIEDDWRDSVIRVAMQASLDGDGQESHIVIIHTDQMGEHSCYADCWCSPLVLLQPLVAEA